MLEIENNSEYSFQQGYLTWADLQDRTDAISKKLAERQQLIAAEQEADDRRGVAFEVEQSKKSEVPAHHIPSLNPSNEQKKASDVTDRRRRISVNTLPSKPTKKVRMD